MRTYETVTIVKPQLSDGEVVELLNTVKDFITKAGGEIVSEEKLGRRKFSHEIHHIRDGFYVYLKFRAEPAFIKNWDEMAKLNESILRSIVMLSIEVKAKPAAPAAK
ncbi:MAG: 30S ribosomal protein S6 [Elusimicrobium sp.]|jgi:small subunit ribosomal protein S6|nr:30S ribosomal protein S6 [Elusimicrobium sp.]